MLSKRGKLEPSYTNSCMVLENQLAILQKD